MSTFFSSYSNLFLTVGTNVLLALSMYIVMRAGMFSVATVGGAALGGYGATLATMRLGTPFALSLAIGISVAALAAIPLAIPGLRLSYMYLAIATIAFNEIVNFVLMHWVSLTGGPLGIVGIPVRVGYTQVYGICGIVLLWFFLLERSPIGRLLVATGSDRLSVAGLGYPPARIKLYALVTSMALAGASGALTAHYSYLVAPSDFGFSRVVDVVSFVIVGGLGAYWGPMLGAVVLTTLPELFRFIGNYRLLVNAGVVLAVVIFYPGGLVGLVGHLRWLAQAAARELSRLIRFFLQGDTSTPPNAEKSSE